jgi:hypothetical protein
MDYSFFRDATVRGCAKQNSRWPNIIQQDCYQFGKNRLKRQKGSALGWVLTIVRHTLTLEIEIYRTSDLLMSQRIETL